MMMGMVCVSVQSFVLLLLLCVTLFLKGEPLYNWKNVRTAVKTMLSGELLY